MGGVDLVCFLVVTCRLYLSKYYLIKECRGEIKAVGTWKTNAGRLQVLGVSSENNKKTIVGTSKRSCGPVVDWRRQYCVVVSAESSSVVDDADSMYVRWHSAVFGCGVSEHKVGTVEQSGLCTE